MQGAAGNPSRIRRAGVWAAALRRGPCVGWSVAARRAGARGLALPGGDVEVLFPGGVRQAVRDFSHWADRRMLAALDEVDLTELRIREKVALAVELRLEVLQPHRAGVRPGLSWLGVAQQAMPGIPVLCLRAGDDLL